MRDIKAEPDPICEDYNCEDKEKIDFLERSYYEAHFTNNVFNTKTSYIPTDSLL